MSIDKSLIEKFTEVKNISLPKVSLLEPWS